MTSMSKKALRKARAEVRLANMPPETLETLRERLSHLPRLGESKREIARLQKRIAELERVK